jgi:hypothetical protein
MNGVPVRADGLCRHLIADPALYNGQLTPCILEPYGACPIVSGLPLGEAGLVDDFADDLLAAMLAALLVFPDLPPTDMSRATVAIMSPAGNKGLDG